MLPKNFNFPRETDFVLVCTFSKSQMVCWMKILIILPAQLTLHCRVAAEIGKTDKKKIYVLQNGYIITRERDEENCLIEFHGITQDGHFHTKSFRGIL